jgi:hypothetical protein
MGKSMNNFGKKIFNTTMITAFILATLFLTGCGDSEMAKEVTNAVKKSVEGEVAKTKEGIKKQFDQVINPGTGKGQKEDGPDAAKSSKEKSKKDSDDEDSSGKKD